MADLPKLLGIDIGNRAVKVCQSVKDGNSFAITALGFELLSSDVLKDESTQAIELIASKINEAIKVSKATTKNCTATIPESMVFSRLITLPAINSSEKEDSEAEAIYYALKPAIPMELADVNVSFLEVNRYTENNKEFVNWYVVAAPKNIVSKYQSFMKKAGLNLLAVETEALANTRAVKANYQLRGDTLIVDFGSNASNIILVRDGNTAFSQTAEVGSQQLNQAISAEFGVDTNQAEQYKLTAGLDFNGANEKVANAMSHTIDILISEINRTITYSRNKLRSAGISHVYLIGGGAALKGLPEYMKAKLEIETTRVNPYQNFKLSKQGSEALTAVGGSADFTVAMGLALKGQL